jgi:hypothetical protein
MNFLGNLEIRKAVKVPGISMEEKLIGLSLILISLGFFKIIF